MVLRCGPRRGQLGSDSLKDPYVGWSGQRVAQIRWRARAQRICTDIMGHADSTVISLVATTRTETRVALAPIHRADAWCKTTRRVRHTEPSPSAASGITSVRDHVSVRPSDAWRSVKRQCDATMVQHWHSRWAHTVRVVRMMIGSGLLMRVGSPHAGACCRLSASRAPAEVTRKSRLEDRATKSQSPRCDPSRMNG